MILENIQIDQFKNHFHLKTDFSPHFNVISGKNGVGKTNVLDAIYCLCTGRCYFNKSDKYNIQKGKDYAVVAGSINNEIDGKKNAIIIGLKKGAAKTIRVDKSKSKKITEYIGSYPAVMICPSDIQIVNGTSDERRKFLDGILSQCNPPYLKALLHYNKLVDMRNKQLKKFSELQSFDPLLLEAIDEQIIPLANQLFEDRKQFLDEFIPYFEETYSTISENKELAIIDYKSHLQENDMAKTLELQLSKDRILERTSRGIHKDDLLFKLKEFGLKQFGSQGQIKSFVISLKLASYRYLKEKLNRTPILLLDDIFEKIDKHRASQLLNLLGKEHYGQVFITDTEKERVHLALQESTSEIVDLVLVVEE